MLLFLVYSASACSERSILDFSSRVERSSHSEALVNFSTFLSKLVWTKRSEIALATLAAIIGSVCVNVIVIARVSTIGLTRRERSNISRYGARRSTSSGERFPSFLDFTVVLVNTVG